MHLRPRVAVSIVNWNTRDHLARCLDSLLAAQDPTLRILVVDNASSDGSASMVRDRYPTVQLLALADNVGFAAANNAAIEASDSDYVLLLNPDVYPARGSLEALTAFLDTHPDATGVGAVLVGLDGRIQTEFYRRLPSRTQILLFYTTIFYAAWRVRAVRHRFFDIAIQGSDPIDVPQLPGACCMVRRNALDRVGNLDPDFFIWFEDVDLCYRLRKAGGHLYVLPNIQMLHAGGASFTGWTMDRQVWQFVLAMLRFLCKHGMWDLVRWSERTIMADLWMKELAIRCVRRMPGADRTALPGAADFATLPTTLRRLRSAVAETVSLAQSGQLIRLDARGAWPIGPHPWAKSSGKPPP